ncbi:MAG: peptide-methionine (S)-S-oxide reductase [Opitutaceae bacterium]|nr:peptide-methionine (S)-S-oxide reductase [Opitutaceae bacterium]|tara:strand:+ start:3397 stop:3975 length:579 start_codon:yes stop_codon:yes gene_type:complete
MKVFTLFALLSAFALPMTTQAKTESLVLGGGCFWCTEAAYEMLPGVKSVVSGYSGGKTSKPTYKEIGTGRTGHAEVIKIDYDPAEVSLDTLLDFFWDAHNPTTLNQQGADIGTQYRSIILYADDAQKAAAIKSRDAAQETFRDPIVTDIVALEKFWEAEGYHQDYFANNPNAGYCQYVIAPKIKKLKQQLEK